MPIQSPCSNKCILDEKSKICLGCYRKIDEIIKWLYFNDSQKQAVLKKVEERKQTIKNKWES